MWIINNTSDEQGIYSQINKFIYVEEKHKLF